MFDKLLKSEIKKAEAAANKFSGRKNCKVSSYYAGNPDEYGFYKVECEICFDYQEPADFSINLFSFTPDRRRSFAEVMQ